MTAQFTVSGAYKTLITYYWMMMIMMFGDKDEGKSIAVVFTTTVHLVL